MNSYKILSISTHFYDFDWLLSQFFRPNLRAFSTNFFWLESGLRQFFCFYKVWGKAGSATNFQLLRCSTNIGGYGRLDALVVDNMRIWWIYCKALGVGGGQLDTSYFRGSRIWMFETFWLFRGKLIDRSDNWLTKEFNMWDMTLHWHWFQ